VIATIIIAVIVDMREVFHILLLLTSLFAFAANFDYIIKVQNGSIRKAGSSIAHIGFALILCGALISMSRSNVISRNTSTVDLSQLGKDFSNNENIMLSRGDTVSMGDYFVTYHNKEQKGFDHYYKIDYLTKDASGFKKEFTLEPLLQNNPRMGLIAEPSTRHQIHRDIYTHVTYAPVKKDEESESTVKSLSMASGDTVFTSSARLILLGLDKDLDRERFHLKDSDLAVAAVILVTDMKGHTDTATPIYAIRGNYLIPEPAVMKETGIKLNFTAIDTQSGKIGIELTETPKEKDFVVMRAIIFPGINVLWMGAIIMMIGSILAIIERRKRTSQSGSKSSN
jgi:cytochrome c-type biogenesis protein CcmF